MTGEGTPPAPSGRRRRWWVGGGIASAVVVGLFVVAGLGSALTSSATHAASGDPKYTCSGSPSLTVSVALPSVAYKPHLVLSLTWKVVNDEDSGFAAYWAMDSYTSYVGVWSLAAGPYRGDYYWMHTYTGLFQIPQGALSPGETGGTPNAVVAPTSAFGNFAGGDWGYILGPPGGETFAPGTLPTSGNLGTKNYGGTTADLLLRTGQTGPTTVYSWYTTYFSPADPSYTNFLYGLGGNAWGFIYNLNPAFFTNPYGGSSTSVNQWCNFGAGAFGDIVPAA